jgi:hypothetical protein
MVLLQMQARMHVLQLTTWLWQNTWMTLTDMCARQAGLLCSRPDGSRMLAISSRFRTYVQQARAWGGRLGPQKRLPIEWLVECSASEGSCPSEPVDAASACGLDAVAPAR